METYYKGEKVSFGNSIIDIVKTKEVTVLEISTVGKMICLSEYSIKRKELLNSIRLDKSAVRDLISALTKVL